jgi:hypothetical protein
VTTAACELGGLKGFCCTTNIDAEDDCQFYGCTSSPSCPSSSSTYRDHLRCCRADGSFTAVASRPRSPRHARQSQGRKRAPRHVRRARSSPTAARPTTVSLTAASIEDSFDEHIRQLPPSRTVTGSAPLRLVRNTPLSLRVSLTP